MTVATSIKGSVPAPMSLPSVVWALDQTADKPVSGKKDELKREYRPSRTILVWLAGLVIGAIFVAAIYVFAQLPALLSPEQHAKCDHLIDSECTVPVDTVMVGSDLCLRRCFDSLYTVCPCDLDCHCPTHLWWKQIGQLQNKPGRCTVICQNRDQAISFDMVCHEINTAMCSII